MSNRRGGERRRLLLRRVDIYRELTQMSHKGWDRFPSSDYHPLESELDRIKARLVVLNELDEQLANYARLMEEYKST